MDTYWLYEGQKFSDDEISAENNQEIKMKMKEYNAKIGTKTNKFFLLLDMYLIFMIYCGNSLGEIKKASRLVSITDVFNKIDNILILIVVGIAIIRFCKNSYKDLKKLDDELINFIYCSFKLDKKLLEKCENKQSRCMKPKNVLWFMVITLSIRWACIYIFNPTIKEYIYVLCGIGVIWIFGYSRPRHFFKVFLKDAYKKLNGIDTANEENVDRKKNSPTKETRKWRRAKLALKSYLNLILDYAILYYVLDKLYILLGVSKGAFEKNFDNIVHSIYYSIVTITGVGYGEQHPLSNIARIYVSLQVICGLILIGLNFAIYMNEEKK